ncbi:MAG: DUF3854 domain-containing protein [Oscillospiraceae bacterium]|nr:DUF3854 domain-containing protein [Oscillospiraceae bacterium]
MSNVSIYDAIDKLCLPQPPSNKRNYNIPCPNCDYGSSSRKKGKHLNINLEKNAWRCPRCENGGYTYELVMFFRNCSHEEAKEFLKTGYSSTSGNYNKKKKPTQQYVKMADKVADISVRNTAYTALLDNLTLTQKHRENLLGRGLTDADIKRLGYKSITKDINLTNVCRNLTANQIKLEGVAGFYQSKAGVWTLDSGNGILIPFRDENGLIQGLHIRNDNDTVRKFRWVSSSDRLNGCSSQSYTHLVGSLDTDTVILTEGAMKADIINALSGKTVLAIAGVSCLQSLESTLKILHKKGVRHIRTAFDMDMFTNLNVNKAYKKMTQVVTKLGFSYSTLVWDGNYKGLDDFLKVMCSKK